MKLQVFFNSIGPINFSGRILPQQRYGNHNENYTKNKINNICQMIENYAYIS